MCAQLIAQIRRDISDLGMSTWVPASWVTLDPDKVDGGVAKMWPESQRGEVPIIRIVYFTEVEFGRTLVSTALGQRGRTSPLRAIATVSARYRETWLGRM